MSTARRRVGAVALAAALLAAIPASAHAEFWIESHGGVGATYKTTNGVQTGAYVEDVDADSHAVRVEYYRYSTSNPKYVLKDTDGSADGTYKYAERSGKIVTMKMCVYNSNPLDWSWCSAWVR